MSFERAKMYPDCPVINRTVSVGGLTKSQLNQKLQQSSIMMNEYGETLLADDRFITSVIYYTIQTVELTVCNLGFSDGATLPQIFSKARELGLELCPLELGPYLRLEYLDQPESHCGDSLQRNQAPSGSITIASEVLTEDDHFPKGFYLRRIDGVLWLRGYRADDLHIWNPHDHFVFCQNNK